MRRRIRWSLINYRICLGHFRLIHPTVRGTHTKFSAAHGGGVSQERAGILCVTLCGVELLPKYSSSRALVIGINAYKTAPPLGYAVSDATAVAVILVDKFFGSPQEFGKAFKYR